MTSSPAITPRSPQSKRRIQLAALALFAMMAIAALGLFMLGGRAVQLNQRVEGLSRQQEELSEELARLTKDKKTLETELAALEERRVQLQAEISVLNTTLGYVRKANPQATATAETRAEQITRVYIQVATDQSAQLAEAVARQLREAGFTVPRIERVRAVPRQPQIRYFNDDTKAAAERVLAVVKRLLPNTTLVLFTPYDTPTSNTRRNHIELWF
jgi:septal ring factor EnvC (AmiA/AmiB activator)